jgi:RHS repeat-associated protein
VFGYRYDTETGLFYVGSRYYDPQIGRWINADDTGVLEVDQDSLIENNLFAYCLNNPAKMTDDAGEIAWFVAAAIGGALFDTGAYMIGAALSGQKITWAGVGKAALVGAITGVAFGAAGKVATKLIKGATTVAKTGKTTVYISKNANKVVQYVGITDDIAR